MSATSVPAPVGAAGRCRVSEATPGPACSEALGLGLRNLCIGPSRSVTCTFQFETSDLEGQVHQGFHEIVAEVQHVPKHVLLCPNLLPQSRDVEPCVLSIRVPSCSLGAQHRDGSGPSLRPRLVLPGAHSASGAPPAPPAAADALCGRTLGCSAPLSSLYTRRRTSLSTSSAGQQGGSGASCLKWGQGHTQLRVLNTSGILHAPR